ncbi:MAG: hypothetical protein A2840_02130 [Candidatus Buchananbacteria bacterium RIFCSPHIGHO2_01_FULL_47_11b]|uniref:Uncharacterized protein n=1 Tax=Candidatus Buchananbacteria bacterium RIFCSPHIGHO2_01_FULL_47_11b TaxID=1797537 RepID=A0A1G1Y706_9BACT|nr:MAG: hypothetical protein A2840_02130 [Candidatus Buchananbacteria bacterium RIFCSPHIGHO2_01_FULL_47_11b]
MRKEHTQLALQALLQAVGVFMYTAGVGWILTNGERIFGKMQNFWGPIAFLMLFVLSATVVGVLIFGRPVLLYLDNKRTEAIILLLTTIAWLAVITFVVLSVQLIG